MKTILYEMSDPLDFRADLAIERFNKYSPIGPSVNKKSLAFLTAALLGAGLGAGGAALTGGNVGQGALFGGIGGAAGGFFAGGTAGGLTGTQGALLGGSLGSTLGSTAFGGETSSGFAPTAKIELTPEAKALEKQLFESIKNDLFPENLAARYIGQAKETEQKRRRVSDKLFSRTIGDDVRSGGTAQAIIAEMSSRLRGGRQGVRRVGEARRGFAENRITNMQNFINLQRQTPLLRAQAALIDQEQEQLSGARQGAALGSIAQLLALSAGGA